MYDEKRKHPRIQVDIVPVDLQQPADANLREKRNGTVKGISAGGIGIVMERPFAKDSLIRISFSLGTGYEFNGMLGKIVRIEEGIKESIIGVQFINPEEENISRVEKYIEEKMNEKGKKKIILHDGTVIFR
jgi:c-di-GMP-binding flagellar brake protein YcgR